MIAYLQNLGHDINEKDESLLTPLDYCYVDYNEYKGIKLAKVLIELGAKYNQKYDDKNTLYDYLKKNIYELSKVKYGNKLTLNVMIEFLALIEKKEIEANIENNKDAKSKTRDTMPKVRKI